MRSSLTAAIRLAGATLTEEDGHLVALDYGSAGGELAACRHGVGIAARLAAVVLELHGAKDELSWLFGGQALEPGRAVISGLAWVIPLSPERMLVVADPRRDRAEIARLRGAEETSAIACADASASHDVLVLVGPDAAAVLDAPELARAGDVPELQEISDVLLAGTPARILRAEPERFILLCDPVHSVALWHALNDVGQRWAIASVGREALEMLEIGVHASSRRTGMDGQV